MAKALAIVESGCWLLLSGMLLSATVLVYITLF